MKMGSNIPKKNRIGEQFTNREDLGNCSFIIVEYNTGKDLWIEFQDEYKARVHTQYDKCLKGEIKNPYQKNKYGVACLGLMSDGSKPNTKKYHREYTVWDSMLKRVYDESVRDRYKLYKNVTVCERWLVFANFLEDIKYIDGYELWFNNPKQGISLDKDLKQQGIKNKVYSLETCCFIPNSENAKEMAYRFTKSIVATNIKTGEKLYFKSQTEASRYLKCSQGNIGMCLRKKRNHCSGYTWEYVGDTDE